MNIKKKFAVSLVLLLAFSLVINVVYAQIREIAGRNHQYFFETGASLGFISGSNTIVLTIASGTFNTTTNRLRSFDEYGVFRFTLNENTSFTVVFTVAMVKVWNSRTNVFNPLASGSTVTGLAADTIEIIWNQEITPALPMTFIFGVLGLVLCFAGPLVTIQKTKEKHYREGFVTGIMFTSLGLAFVLSWLFG